MWGAYTHTHTHPQHTHTYLTPPIHTHPPTHTHTHPHTQLRMEFESNRTASPALVTRLIKEAELKLVEFQHPDPYCIPGMPGGSLFMRNPPLPMSVCFPDGDLPEDAPKREINPDWSTAVEGGGKSGSGQVVVDFTRKNMT
jgi:hypothetical protein